jgi:four helix bundle protein
MGSSSELEYLFLLAHDLAVLPDEPFQSLSSQLIEIRKMLNTLIQRTKVNRQPLIANR